MDGLKTGARRVRGTWRMLIVGIPLLPLVAAPALLPAAENRGTPGLYAYHCAGCHTGDANVTATGSHAAQARGLDCGLISLMSDPTLFLIIKDGGPAAGLRAEMPAYGDKLSYDQIVDLLHYLRAICTGKGRNGRQPAEALQP